MTTVDIAGTSCPTKGDADKICLQCGKPKDNGCECWVWR